MERTRLLMRKKTSPLITGEMSIEFAYTAATIVAYAAVVACKVEVAYAAVIECKVEVAYSSCCSYIYSYSFIHPQLQSHIQLQLPTHAAAAAR